jgi:hypothetical protein
MFGGQIDEPTKRRCRMLYPLRRVHRVKVEDDIINEGSL